MQTKVATRYRHTPCWPNFSSPAHHLSSYLCFHHVATPASVGTSLCVSHTWPGCQQGWYPHTAGTLVALTLFALVQVPTNHWCAGERLSPGCHPRGDFWGGFSPKSCQGWMREGGKGDVKGIASTSPFPPRAGWKALSRGKQRHGGTWESLPSLKLPACCHRCPCGWTGGPSAGQIFPIPPSLHYAPGTCIPVLNRAHPPLLDAYSLCSATARTKRKIRWVCMSTWAICFYFIDKTSNSSILHNKIRLVSKVWTAVCVQG